MIMMVIMVAIVVDLVLLLFFDDDDGDGIVMKMNDVLFVVFPFCLFAGKPDLKRSLRALCDIFLNFVVRCFYV